MLTEVSEVDQRLAAPWAAAERRPALLALLRLLDARGYDHVTATPGTHARVVARDPERLGRDAREVLGWSRCFEHDALDPELLAALRAAGAVAIEPDGRLRPLLRASRVAGRLFLHSAFPTDAPDSVFLGPDSCRFAQLIAARLDPRATRVLDYGAGAGVGGIVAASLLDRAHLTLADVNPRALALASVNAEHFGVTHAIEQVQAPDDLAGAFDLIVTHPPFMIDAAKRAYRDGGDLYGARLSLEWVVQGLALLAPGGRLILNTGVSIVDGRDVLRDALRERLPAIGVRLDYRELDPDIFSEDLDQPGYDRVERIAAVGLVVERSGGA
ncbi:methyltransferase [Sphingomonas sp. RRHST34]|uniref:Methyltransferase n=1 Tax=Sphingomonas citri TaxID=2862499 RepID=A0ABS7BNC5_9SPHN|nr:methyltransferase [Sphingomonas citri]MBW6531103.1 methyltransferase [Sphingomonas citri]